MPFARGIIIKYQFKEYLDFLWELFDKMPKDDGHSKCTILYSIAKLGDSTKVFNQYISDIWRITNNSEKIIKEDYLYKLIDYIPLGYQDKKYVDELFKLLDYIQKNPNKDKKILWQVDSEFGEMYLGLKYITYSKLVKVVKSPFTIKYDEKITEEKVIKLLEWYSENPDYEINKGY